MVHLRNGAAILPCFPWALFFLWTLIFSMQMSREGKFLTMHGSKWARLLISLHLDQKETFIFLSEGCGVFH